MITELEIHIAKKGYDCWDRDKEFFDYFLASSLIRKPKVKSHLSVLCKSDSITTITATLKWIFRFYIYYKEIDDERLFYLWILGLHN